MFENQMQAKAFFVERIIFQAQKDNVPLSDAERYMLQWTETEGAFEMNQALIDQFNAETNDAQYEKKISSLLKSAYETDVANASEMKERYRDAYKTLKRGDHYILVMIEEAIGAKLKKWGVF